MRICYFADGESIHIVRWCKHFASLGHDVHLISFKNVNIEGVTSHFIRTGNIAVSGGNWKVLFKFRKVRALLKKIKPDIFHSHYATSYGITGALCGFHPYVITTLGTDVLISPQQSGIYRMLLKFAFSKADWINTLAIHMSEAVQKIGADMRKVSVIPFGIDTTIFNDKKRRENGDSFSITSTRNHEPVYNIPHLIHAVGKIKTSIPNLKFNIIGEGSLRKELECLVTKEDLSGVTKFYGRISQEKMVEMLCETNIFVTVSLSDGNNLSLVEAMACGCFCIASDIPANRPWITNNENGFLVEINDIDTLADRILFAYKNYSRLQDSSVKINKKIIEVSGVWEKNMEKVEEKYKSLIRK